MSKVEESKILASKILMLNKKNRETVLNVLKAFIVAETANKLGIEASVLNEIIKQ